jgi:hypothetical protein
MNQEPQMKTVHYSEFSLFDVYPSEKLYRKKPIQAA